MKNFINWLITPDPIFGIEPVVWLFLIGITIVGLGALINLAYRAIL